jgi:hypothetical protein
MFLLIISRSGGSLLGVRFSAVGMPLCAGCDIGDGPTSCSSLATMTHNALGYKAAEVMTEGFVPKFMAGKSRISCIWHTSRGPLKLVWSGLRVGLSLNLRTACGSGLDTYAGKDSPSFAVCLSHQRKHHSDMPSCYEVLLKLVGPEEDGRLISVGNFLGYAPADWVVSWPADWQVI